MRAFHLHRHRRVGSSPGHSLGKDWASRTPPDLPRNRTISLHFLPYCQIRKVEVEVEVGKEKRCRKLTHNPKIPPNIFPKHIETCRKLRPTAILTEPTISIWQPLHIAARLLGIAPCIAVTALVGRRREDGEFRLRAPDGNPIGD